MPKPLLEKSHCCSHTLEQRTLGGTWCTPELVKAVEQGYEIKRIDGAAKNGTLYAIREHVTQNQTGICRVPRQRDHSRTKSGLCFCQKDNISLNPTLIVKNPGRKATAKLMLNSFWGKFGENLHKPTTQSVYTAAGLFDIISNELLDIRQIRICNEESLEIVYQNLKENEPDNGRVNIFVAAFTTCHARLKLYEHLEKL